MKRKCGKIGIPINENTIYSLSFADDQVVIEQDLDEIDYMTRKLIEEYDQWGLDLNLTKTEYMSIGGPQQNMQLDNEIMGKR